MCSNKWTVHAAYFKTLQTITHVNTPVKHSHFQLRYSLAPNRVKVLVAHWLQLSVSKSNFFHVHVVHIAFHADREMNLCLIRVRLCVSLDQAMKPPGNQWQTHTHTHTHFVTEPCNNFAMIVCGRVFVNEGVWIMLLLLEGGGGGVRFNLVALVDKWSLALGKRRVCANS